MTSFQKAIKAAAICFAIFLTVTIISAIGRAALGFLFIFNNVDSKRIAEVSESYEGEDISRIIIDNSVGDLYIIEGSKFYVEGTNVGKSFRAKVANNGTLKITNKNVSFGWFTDFFREGQIGNSKITIYIPKGVKTETIQIHNGVGELHMENFETEFLDVELGTGDAYATNIISDKTTIDAGVGNVDFENISFTDMDLDSGVGDTTVEGKILGKSDIECGVGDIELIIELGMDEYDLDIETGLGDVYINGEKTSNVNVDNKGADHSLDIQGGVGEVEIKFSNSGN